MSRFKIIKPDYVYIKLKPNNSIKNNNTHLLARTISNMYKSILQQINREDEKVFRIFKRTYGIPTKGTWKRTGKVSYYVYMEKEKIEFYFIIPAHYYKVMKERISGVWQGITVEKVDDIPQFSEDATKYQMVYEKEDGLSLTTNRTDNDLLTASLNVVDLMEEGDKAGIFYNFIPMSQNGFKYSYESTIQKVKDGQPTDRNKLGLMYVIKMGVSLLDSLIKEVSEAVAGKSIKKDASVMEGIIERLNGDKQVTESTKKKIKGQILQTQILVFAESKNKAVVTQRSYANAISQGFDVISGDNRMIKETYVGKFKWQDTQIAGAKINKLWDEEVQSMISLPGRELLDKYPFMEKVETQETQLPKDLQTGVMCIGETTFRGHRQKAYLTEDDDHKKLATLLVGPSRAGKSNLITHLCIDAIENDECVIIIDYIKKCELSSDVAKCFPKEKVLEISVNDIENMQGLGYNEVGHSDNPFYQYDNAKRQTSNTLALVNAINDGKSQNSCLSSKMERYLESACLAVYITGGSIKDVFGVLLNHKTRHDFIKKVPKAHLVYMQDYIDGLKELDERDSKGVVVGTKTQASIIDRLNVLKRNTYMELMLKKGTENNINLVEEMQKNQVIIISMPEAMFPTKGDKDVLVTYWVTKIWLALQVRADKYNEKDYKKVNLVIDELVQVEGAQRFLASLLLFIAKFGMKPILSCHEIGQLKHMKEDLKGANASYMFIAGCVKDNYTEMKDELLPFTAEDMLNLKRYHSMNYVKTKDGYARFITELPDKVEYRIKKTNKKNAPLVIE